MLELLLATQQSNPNIVGNFALFVAGSSTPITGSPTPLNTTERYAYSDDAVTSGATLFYARYSQGAAGNYNSGTVISGDVQATKTERVAYATETVSAGTDIGSRTGTLPGIGSPTKGYFGGRNYVWQYSFVDETCVRGTTLMDNRTDEGGSAGNVSGMFVGGYNSTSYVSRDILTYSTEGRTNGLSLTTAMYGITCAGDKNNGWEMGGQTTASSYRATCGRYNYAGNTRAAATSLSVARSFSAAVCEGTRVITAGGLNTATSVVNSTEIRTIATDGITGGTAMSQARVRAAGLSSIPGGLT